MFYLTCVVLLVLFAVVQCSPPKPTLGVIVDSTSSNGLTTVPFPYQGDDKEHITILAWGGYDDTITIDGWSYLSIYSNENQPNKVQARAAGYLEAALTHQRMFEFATNKHDGFGWSPKLRDYVDANNEFMRTQIEKAASAPAHEEHSEMKLWWEQVSLLLEQQQGLIAGYNEYHSVGQEISEEILITMSMHSDMDTLCPLFGGCFDAPLHSKFPIPQPQPVNANPSAPLTAPNRIKDHCSVIIKLLSDADTGKLSELYTAHTTWTGFEDMTRIYKLYDLPYSVSSASYGGKKQIIPGRKIATSSYPGNLFSTDDYYTLGTGLAVTETTIDNHNTDLWTEVLPTTVLTWLRTMVANRVATDGPSWGQAFSMHNSGTYNNEFHIVDYNVFEKSQKHGKGDLLLPHVLTIVDQMPGANNVERKDMTSHLQKTSYWGSYNRPGLEHTYKLANYTATTAAFGPHYSHKLCARAQIFDMNQHSIINEANLKKVMRFNKFNDPTQPKEITEQMCNSGPSASNAISERGDLTPLSSNCADDITQQNEGGIDLKYTTAKLMKASQGLASIAQSGPTYDDQPPFVWSTSPFPERSHVGMPDRWAFPYVTVDFSSSVDKETNE